MSYIKRKRTNACDTCGSISNLERCTTTNCVIYWCQDHKIHCGSCGETGCESKLRRICFKCGDRSCYECRGGYCLYCDYYMCLGCQNNYAIRCPVCPESWHCSLECRQRSEFICECYDDAKEEINTLLLCLNKKNIRPPPPDILKREILPYLL